MHLNTSDGGNLVSRPTISWNWQNLPANSDVVTPVAKESLDNKEFFIFMNHTTGKLLFEYDGDYGVLTTGD
jgi:hypothetical protein